MISALSRAAEEWLLIEWPKGEAEPTKYWLSTLPDDIAFDRLVDLAKLRWRIERDYQELKQEVGLSAFRGARLAWLSPPRHAVHRRLRLPDLRAGDDSPLRTSSRRAAPDSLPYPTVIDPEAPPIRPERHIPNSIATMRRRLIVALVRSLARCPCCNAPRKPATSRRL